MSTHERQGILLVNLGTPESPSTGDVRRYLREFLSDPLVIDINPVGRAILLHGFILRTRPAKSAAAYQKIWTEAGSPLLVHGHALREAIAPHLAPAQVELAMRYGSPSIRDGLQALLARGCTNLMVVPLYPHYAQSSTLSTIEKVRAELASIPNAPTEVDFYPAFYDHPAFINALAKVSQPRLEAFVPDRILMSFHGLPERQMPDAGPGSRCLAGADCCDSVREDNRNCYRAQCYATARALADRLDIADRYQVSFQSRLGRAKWIEPHTDVVLSEIAASGVKRLAVLCPAFVADCLETLEEIGMRAKEQFCREGGEDLQLIPCLNADPAWVRALDAMIRERLAS